MNIPELKTDVNADPITIFAYVHSTVKYEKIDDETVKGRILQCALKGRKEKEQGLDLGHANQAALKTIADEMKKSYTKSQLERKG